MAFSIRASAMTEAGFWRDAQERLWGNRAALISACILLIIAAAAVLGPWLSPHAYDELDWRALASAPTLENSHWLGTDRLGRDLLVRTLHGTRTSLLIGVLSSAVSLIIGVAWGATAGYAGGRIDGVMMRIVDILYSLPYIFFVIILTVVFGRNVLLLFVAIGAVGWLTMARIVRGQTLSLKHREFIQAAEALGVPSRRIITRHVVPNVAGAVIVYATLLIPQMILFESFLSFLGLGVQEPLASLGSLVAEGASEMESAPWMLLVPATVLVLLLGCLNFIGDGLRDALDPRRAG
jgi:oligopeptide transport system permease protein